MSLNIEFISAGAGSGKTYSLTEKLKELLNDGTIKPSGVIATTFTRLAAGELRERVREALMQSGQLSLANQIEQAAINTVNGVCGELLQRFSFEAGLSPEQIVLEEDQAKQLFNEAMDSVLDTDVEKIRKLNALAVRLGRRDRDTQKLNWRKDVKDIADAARANNCTLEELSLFAAQSSDGLLSHFRKPIERDLSAELLSAINHAVNNIDLTIDTTKGTKGYVELLEGCRAGLVNHRLTWAEWIKLSKSGPTKKSVALAEPIQIIASDVESHPGLHRDISEYTQYVMTLANESLASYQLLKKQQGLVDFVDQELQLYQLLENETVCDVLRSELQLLMVDEFQDTSPIQLALFIRLSALADKVIWVGDVKQAIYGFRGSDPSLMQAVLKAAQADGQKTQILEKSWRSRPPLVEYCNSIFKEAFSNSLASKHVVLEPARKELTSNPAVMHWSLTGKKVDVRMAALTEGIHDLIEGDYQIVDKQTNKPRNIRFGDIAVLCRSNARLSSLASACNQAGISVSYKRTGLLKTPEVVLALACLRRMSDASDTLATAQIRAIANGESVEDWLPERLAFIQSDETNASWGEHGVDSEGDSTASHILKRLAAARSSLAVVTPVEALREALVNGQVREVITRIGPNEQSAKSRLANLDSLVELASSYESNCSERNQAATVAGLLMSLYDSAANDEDWQAVGADEKTVTLVTHHGAKGLEWPVVVAVDLESKVRTRLWGLSVTPRADAFDVNEPLAQRRLRFWVYPFGQQSAGITVVDRIEESDEGIAAQTSACEEEKRLLYVTFTRARDLLVLPLNSSAKAYPSLDVLGANWLVPDADQLALPDGKIIPTAMHTYDGSTDFSSEASDYIPYWYASPSKEKAISANPKIRRKYSPSSAVAIDSARVGKIINIGERVALHQVSDMSMLGSALHGVIAALINNDGTLAQDVTENILQNFEVADSITATDVLAAAQRFYKALYSNFNVQSIQVEYPISSLNDQGQEIFGFIDLLLETDEGWVIVDHKSSPQPRSEWESIACSYSGQLACYKEVLSKLSDKPVVGVWIHFVVTGGMVEVLL